MELSEYIKKLESARDEDYNSLVIVPTDQTVRIGALQEDLINYFFLPSAPNGWQCLGSESLGTNPNMVQAYLGKRGNSLRSYNNLVHSQKKDIEFPHETITLLSPEPHSAHATFEPMNDPNTRPYGSPHNLFKTGIVINGDDQKLSGVESSASMVLSLSRYALKENLPFAVSEFRPWGVSIGRELFFNMP